MPSLGPVFPAAGRLHETRADGAQVFVLSQSAGSFNNVLRTSVFDGYGNPAESFDVAGDNHNRSVDDGGLELFALGGGVIAAPYQTFSQSPQTSGLEVAVFGLGGQTVQRIFLDETSSFSNRVSTADVAVNSAFDFTVFWTADEDDPNGRDVFRQSFDIFGNALSEREQINAFDAGEQDDVVAASFDSGRYAAAWEDSSSGTEQIKIRFYRPNGNQQGGESRVNLFGDSGDRLVDPHMEVLAGQTLVVGWSDRTDGQAFFRIYNQFGTAQGGPIEVNLVPERGGAVLTDIARTSDGGFYAAYITQTGLEPLGNGTSARYIGDFKIRKFDASGAAEGGPMTISTGVAMTGSLSVSSLPAFADTEFNDDRTTFQVFELDTGGFSANGRVFGQGSAGADIEFMSSPGTFVAGAGDDLVVGTNVADTLYGGDGIDGLYGGGGNDFIRDLMTGGYTDGVTPRQILSGDLGDDIIIAGEGTTALGGFGNDTIRGRADFVEMRGEGGDDRLFIGGESGVAYGGDGSDVIRGEGDIYGGAGDDILYANGGSMLDGGDGDDVIRGSAQGDEIDGGAGNDRIFTNASGQGARDYAWGGAGNDRLVGSLGEQVLFGGAGNDRLEGANDDDTLTGGAGADRFIYGNLFVEIGTPLDQQLVSFGHDVITDFQNGVDLIVLSSSIAADFSGLDIVTSGTTAIIEIDPNSSISVLNGAGLLDVSDFEFI